jgi:hypothetical protein
MNTPFVPGVALGDTALYDNDAVVSLVGGQHVSLRSYAGTYSARTSAITPSSATFYAVQSKAGTINPHTSRREPLRVPLLIGVTTRPSLLPADILAKRNAVVDKNKMKCSSCGASGYKNSWMNQCEGCGNVVCPACHAKGGTYCKNCNGKFKSIR